MEDASVVSVLYCTSDLDQETRGRTGMTEPAFPIRERRLEQRHGEVQIAFVVTKVEDRNDVRVLDRKHLLDLALHEPKGGVAEARIRPDHLQRRGKTCTNLTDAKYDAHPAMPDALDDFVIADARSLRLQGRA